MFAAMAASRCDVPLYVLKHDMPGLYRDRVERTGARFHTAFQLSETREFFYPVVWPESAVDPSRATRIPPVALEGDGEARDDADVVVVPSHYSELDRIATQLRRQGYDVINVADDDWDAVPSLLPYVRGAEVVVCSGYSTVMDAAVAGTPCVVHPATDEQAAVADWLERFDVGGFAVAESPLDVLDAVASPPDAPAFPNGAEYIAETVRNDLRNPDPYAASGPSATDAAETDVSRVSGLGTVAAVPTLCAVVLSTVGGVATGIRRVAAAGRRAGEWVLGRILTAGSVAGDGVRYGTTLVSDGLRAVASTVENGSRTALRCSSDAVSGAVTGIRSASRALVRRCGDVGRLAPSLS
jgi:hypothetical protein